MIRHTCQFIIDKEAGKPDGKLRFRVKWDHNRDIVAFNLGFRIDPAKWSLETQRCKTNSTHGKKRIPASEINRELSRYEEAAKDTFRRFERKTRTDKGGVQCGVPRGHREETPR